jgi:hypothetical protein
MKTDGQIFLDRLACSSAEGFKMRFSKISTRLGLGASFRGSELSLLYKSAFYAALCNIAFNGLGGCDGQIKPSREANRISLERKFMAAREKFWACAGWRALCAAQKESIHNIFLRVFLTEDNLA